MLVLGAWVTLASAQGLSVAQAQRYLNDSGLQQVIDAIPELMAQQINLGRLEQDPEVVERASRAINQSLSRLDSSSMAIDYLTEKADAQKLEKAFGFLSTEVGKRILAAEVSASNPSAQMEMQAYAMQLAENPPEPTRARLIQSLVDKMDTDRWFVTIVESAFFAVAEWQQAMDQASRPALQSELQTEWQRIQPIVLEQFEQSVLLGAYYSYRKLSDEDVSAYVEFLDTPSGKAYSNTGLDVIKLYMNAFFKDLKQAARAQ